MSEYSINIDMEKTALVKPGLLNALILSMEGFSHAKDIKEALLDRYNDGALEVDWDNLTISHSVYINGDSTMGYLIDKHGNVITIIK